MRRLPGLLFALVLAGCGGGTPASASPPPASSSAGVSHLYVADVDGPPVDILIAGTVVASIPCSGYATLTEGSGLVPSLPWSLDVRRQAAP